MIHTVHGVAMFFQGSVWNLLARPVKFPTAFWKFDSESAKLTDLSCNRFSVQPRLRSKLAHGYDLYHSIVRYRITVRLKENLTKELQYLFSSYFIGWIG
jgi:hypothetical protein